MQTEFDVGIFSGWSDVGGSTESFINLTNLFNENGINTVFFGPHSWHLGKCKSAIIPQATINITFKNIIYHFLKYPLEYKKYWETANHILSCHETTVNPLYHTYRNQISNNIFDHIQFVSESQREYQLSLFNLPPDHTIVIPNITDPKLKKISISHTEKIGGIIGSIDTNKATHESIISALHDGCKRIKIYGKVVDVEYYNTMIQPMISTNPSIISYEGVVSDKIKIYESITDVYHNSKSETWGYIQAECDITGIPFHSSSKNNLMYLSNNDILKMWKGILV